MHSTPRTVSFALAGLLIAVTTTVVAQRGTAPTSTGVPADVTARIVASAHALLSTLVEPSQSDVSAHRPAARRYDGAAARSRHDAAVGRPEPRRVSQGDRHHAWR